MKAMVVYESMYGNTHVVADAIADGLRSTGEAVAVGVHDARRALLEGVDLVVVGGPTHAHGMSRRSTRRAAADAASRAEGDLTLDVDAEGLRAWFETLGTITAGAAAFGTRIDAPAALTGRASKGIARRLSSHGFVLMAEPESFLVAKDSRLEPRERERARAWGRRLGADTAARRVSS
jgi:hypothetical protein